jgi:hypothetical protein
MKKELWLSYLLALAAFFGPAGLHRFYLGRPLSGIIYFLTWGFLGIGTIYDLIHLPEMVTQENAKLLPPHRRQLYLESGGKRRDREARKMLKEYKKAGKRKLSEDERDQLILQLAKSNEGGVTVAMVALEVDLSMRKAKKVLERLRKGGFCELDVSEDGAELYRFLGLDSAKPLLP